MKRFSLYKIINAGLRVLPLGAKFILFTILSKYLGVEEYGVFSLIATTVTLSIFFLGLDLYNFSIRDLLSNRENINTKISNIFSFYFFIYIIFLLLGIPLLIFSGFSTNIVIVTMLICILEHLNQEIFRLQIAFKKVLLANLSFFVRVCGWTIFLLGIIFFDEKISIVTILKIWLLFNIIGLIVNIFIAGKELIQVKFSPKIDFKYLEKALKTSALFFIGTISLKSIEYVNRYIVDIILGKEMTGVFSFYSNIAIVITVYVNAIVISFELPVIIENSKSGNLKSFFKKFEKSLLVQILVISTLLLLAIWPLLIWQNIDLYKEHFPLLIFLLIGGGLMNYSLCYHFYLYVKNEDKKILFLTVKSGIVNILVTIFLTYFFGVYGTCMAFMIAGVYMFFLRRTSAKKLNYD